MRIAILNAVMFSVIHALALVSRRAAAAIKAQIGHTLATHGTDAVLEGALLAVVSILRDFLLADAASSHTRCKARRHTCAAPTCRVTRTIAPFIRHNNLGQFFLAFSTHHCVQRPAIQHTKQFCTAWPLRHFGRSIPPAVAGLLVVPDSKFHIKRAERPLSTAPTHAAHTPGEVRDDPMAHAVRDFV